MNIRSYLWMRLGLLAVVSTLGACAVSVRAPTDQQIVTSMPVSATVGANGTMTLRSVQRTFGGVATDVTADFVTVDQYSATAVWPSLPNGSYTLAVTADVYCWYCSGPNVSTASRVFSVNVQTTTPAPTLTGIAPTSGPVGTALTLTGTGFANGMSAVIGGQTVAPTSVSPTTSAMATVPAGLSGTVNVSVKVGAQSSGTRSFTITPPPPTPVRVLRTGDTNIQLVDVSMPAAPSLVGAAFSAGLSAGGMSNTVGCTIAGARFLRSTSSRLESCPVDAAGTVGPACSSVTAAGSPTASDVAVSGTLVVRATDSGIEVFRLAANGTLSLLGQSNLGTASPTGSAVDFPKVATPTFVVRGHANGIDVFDITTPSAPTLAGRVVNAGISTTGVDVAVVGSGRVVRAYSSGLDQYDISTPSAPARIGAGPLNVDLSASRAAVAAYDNGARAVRSTSVGIEVFDITAANPVRLGRLTGGLSATGSDVVIDSDGFAVRSTADSVEVYDIATNPALPVRRGQVAASPSATGVCLANR